MVTVLCGSDLISILPLTRDNIMHLIEDAEELRRRLRVEKNLG